MIYYSAERIHETLVTSPVTHISFIVSANLHFYSTETSVLAASLFVWPSDSMGWAMFVYLFVFFMLVFVLNLL